MSAQRTILIVDDEENILSSLRRLFHAEKEQYNIISATSGEQALELISEKKIDLIISDQRMPAMSGVEFLKKAKNSQPDAIRILLSGHSDFNAIISAVNEGEIYRFITKPWDGDAMLDLVKSALRQHDLLRTVNNIVLKLGQFLKKKDSARIETVREEKSIIVKITTQDQFFSADELNAILNELMSDVLKGAEAAPDRPGINCASGMIEKKSGIAVMTMNLEGATTLVIELPVTLVDSTNR